MRVALWAKMGYTTKRLVAQRFDVRAVDDVDHFFYCIYMCVVCVCVCVIMGENYLHYLPTIYKATCCKGFAESMIFENHLQSIYF